MSDKSLKSELDIYKNKEKERKEKARLYRIKSDKKRYEGGKTTTQIRDLNTLLMEEVERLNKQLQKLQLAELYNEEPEKTKQPKNSDHELENLRLELGELKHLRGVSDEQLEEFIETLNKPKTTNEKIKNYKYIIAHINEYYDELPDVNDYN